ncbi:hypothetical protein MKEN_01060500 [Mycena kentingensis (nom. inval.)]|nr:hypothetical protein MKEN_01060500 [Mycena kentingensis (nom. inval.)]
MKLHPLPDMSEYQCLEPPQNGATDHLYGYKLYDAEQAQRDENDEFLWQARSRLLACSPLRSGPAQLAWVANHPSTPTILVYFAVYSAEHKVVVGTASGSDMIPSKTDIEDIARTLGVSGEPTWVEDDGTIFARGQTNNAANVLQTKAYEKREREKLAAAAAM